MLWLCTVHSMFAENRIEFKTNYNITNNGIKFQLQRKPFEHFCKHIEAVMCCVRCYWVGDSDLRENQHKDIHLLLTIVCIHKTNREHRKENEWDAYCSHIDTCLISKNIEDFQFVSSTERDRRKNKMPKNAYFNYMLEVKRLEEEARGHPVSMVSEWFFIRINKFENFILGKNKNSVVWIESVFASISVISQRQFHNANFTTLFIYHFRLRYPDWHPFLGR